MTTRANGSGYNLDGHIRPEQRFTHGRTCPICGGTEDDRRGQGTRCFGFLSDDGQWCHCTRDEFAGRAVLNPGTGAYQHRLKGHCPCGSEHAPADPAPARARKRKGEIDDVYTYHNRDGSTLFQAVRFKPKDFRQRRPDGMGGHVWNLDGIEPVLFNLPGILATKPGDMILIAEGEKAVNALAERGFVATCSPMGAGKWRDRYGEDLRGRNVVILPDNDRPGRDHAEQVARSVSGVAASVKVVPIPGMAEHGDAFDFFAQGGTAEALRRLIDEASGWIEAADGPEEPPCGDGRAGPVQIIISTRESEVISEAIEALIGDPNIFVRGNTLGTILRTPTPRTTGIARPAGSPRIAPLAPARLRDLLTGRAALKKRGGVGGADLINCHPPDWLIPGITARGEWPGFRPLEAVVETPIIRPDGTILETSGWDEATSLFYEPNAPFPSIKGKPTKDDASEAIEDLTSIVADFPFKSPTHRMVWVAGVLESLGRFAIEGPCPLILLDANAPGTGKSKLADLIAIIATGRDMPRTAYPDNDEEMRKRITSVALAGDRLMLIDNIATSFGGSSLDSALTAMTWRDRILGRSEMTPELPLFTCWLASGNNVGLRGDALRRVVPCRLETTVENPEERKEFSIPGDLMKYVRRERPRLVAAALTILRAHAVAGRPDGGLTPLGSFESWSEVIRSAIHWVTGLDPCATRDELRANDPEALARAALVNGWAELLNAEKAEHGITVAEALKLVKADSLKESPCYGTLYGVFLEWSRTNDLPSARSIGMRLNAIKGRVIDGQSIVAVPAGNGTQAWKVIRPKDGTNGTKGTNSSPFARESQHEGNRVFPAWAGNSPSSPISPPDQEEAEWTA